jgi:catechol 2,3-dioxygenase-like lactoylglutathione lyase family enzyme
VTRASSWPAAVEPVPNIDATIELSGESDMATSATMPLQPRKPITPEPISPDHFAHFVARTSKFEEMRRWYQTVLNAQVVFDNGKLCFITYDDEHHRLALVDVPKLQAPAAESWGLAHLAYSYKNLREFLSTYLRLKNAGIVPFRPVKHGPTISMYYHDPDGTAIELKVDAFLTKEMAVRYLRGEDFKSNPIGVPFDPDELVKAYEAGVPEAELLRRPASEPA